MDGDPSQCLLRLNSFWHGPALPPLAAACLRSFVEMGHAVTLHVYDEPRGVPGGIALADASQILPPDEVFVHRAWGTVATFADRFRYEMLARDTGAWIDCDLLCVQPLADAPCVFGWEDTDHINNAVLMLPADSAALADLRAIFTTPRWVPPWFGGARRFRYKIKHLLVPGYGVSHMPWATTGPQALTHYARRHDLLRHAAPRGVFYPVHFRDFGVFLGDVDAVRRHLVPETRCIHLWQTHLDAHASGPPPRHSFLARILDGTWRAAIAA